jgi:hypothetical protein
LQEKVTVPHEEPAIVRGYLESTFIRHCLQGLAEEPGERTTEESANERGRRRLESERLVTRAEAGSIEACKTQAVQEAEKFFFVGPKRQGCILCHTVTPPETSEVFPKLCRPLSPSVGCRTVSSSTRRTHALTSSVKSAMRTCAPVPRPLMSCCRLSIRVRSAIRQLAGHALSASPVTCTMIKPRHVSWRRSS